MDIMREAAKAGNTGVIHCYSYAAPMAKEYISIKEVVKQLAQIKQVSEETVITTTLANAKRLYRLEENCG